MSLVLVLALAIAIGGTAGVSSVAHIVLVRPLPWPRADRLVAIHAVQPDRRSHPAFANTWNAAPISWAAWQDLRRAAAFDEVGVWFATSYVLHGERRDLSRVMYVSSSLLGILGARPAIGRLFTAAEDDGPSTVVVLTHAAWVRHFGERADALGQTVFLAPSPESASVALTVVGVLDRSFRFPREDPDFLRPIGVMVWNGRFEENRFLRGLGRLAPEVSPAAALAAADPLVRRHDPPERRSARIVAIRDDVAGRMANQLPLYLAGAAVLFLVGATSVAGLLVSDARARTHEIAVRAALGAGRRQILQQIAIEHLTVGLIGALGGLLFGGWIAAALLALAPPGLPTVSGIGATLYLTAVGAGLALVVALVFGLLPVFQIMRTWSGDAMLARGLQATPAGIAAHRAIVCGTLGLTLILLVCASLFGETLRRLGMRPLGFDPSDVGVATIGFTLYSTAGLRAPRPDSSIQEIVAEYESLTNAGWIRTQDVLQRVAVLPFVEAAAGVNTAPFSGALVQYAVQARNGPSQEAQVVQHLRVTEDYFRVLRIPLLSGRTFAAGDRGRPVAVVSRELERRVFGGRAVGRELVRGNRSYEVIGVVENVRHRELSDEDLAAVYLLNSTLRDVNHLLVRSADVASVVPLVRRAIEDADPDARVTSTATLESLVARSAEEQRVRAWLSAAFGGAALLMAGVGIFMLTERAAAERRREIAVRIALGAAPRDIGAMLLRDTATTIALGLAAGIPAALAVSQAVRSFLYGIPPTTPLVFVAASAVLAAAATAASLLPARRAGRMDPVEALRN